MDNRESLEQQLRDLEARKTALFEGGNADQVEVGRLNEQINETRQRLSSVESQEIAEDIGASDKPYILQVSGEDINLRDYIDSDANHRLIAIAISQKLLEVNTVHQAVTTELTNRFEIELQQYRAQITNADEAADAKYNVVYEQLQSAKLENTILKAERDELKAERHNIVNERDDFERRFQAAISEIETLRKQLEAANNRVEVKAPTNLDGNLAEAMRKANEAKRAIYNVQNDPANINYTANFLDNDEEFTDKLIYIGKYRQASKEEVTRFRAELEAAKETVTDAQEPVSSDLEAGIEPPTFPPEVPYAHNTDGLDENNVGGQDVPDGGSGVVTREEYESLRHEVTMIAVELKARSILPMNWEAA